MKMSGDISYENHMQETQELHQKKKNKTKRVGRGCIKGDVWRYSERLILIFRFRL